MALDDDVRTLATGTELRRDDHPVRGRHAADPGHVGRRRRQPPADQHRGAPAEVQERRTRPAGHGAVIDHDNPYRYVEVRGHVVEVVRGQEARDHIDACSQRYFGKDYPAPDQVGAGDPAHRARPGGQERLLTGAVGSAAPAAGYGRALTGWEASRWQDRDADDGLERTDGGRVLDALADTFAPPAQPPAAEADDPTGLLGPQRGGRRRRAPARAAPARDAAARGRRRTRQAARPAASHRVHPAAAGRPRAGPHGPLALPTADARAGHRRAARSRDAAVLRRRSTPAAGTRTGTQLGYPGSAGDRPRPA